MYLTEANHYQNEDPQISVRIYVFARRGAESRTEDHMVPIEFGGLLVRGWIFVIE